CAVDVLVQCVGSGVSTQCGAYIRTEQVAPFGSAKRPKPFVMPVRYWQIGVLNEALGAKIEAQIPVRHGQPSYGGGYRMTTNQSRDPRVIASQAMSLQR